MCCGDLAWQQRNKPVYELEGGTPSGLDREGLTPAEFETRRGGGVTYLVVLVCDGRSLERPTLKIMDQVRSCGQTSCPESTDTNFRLYQILYEKHFACMTHASNKTFMARVRAALPDLHPTERRLADSVLDFPGDMAGYSASEIANLAGVSNATVSRFVRKLGYASFEEARKAVREEGRNGAALLRFGATAEAESGSVAAHLEQSHLNLNVTYGGLNTEDVDALAKAMHRARRVWLAGYRAGFPLANYLAWQVTQVLPDVNLIPRPGETLAESVTTISADDVLVMLLLRRSPKLAWTLAETAASTGAKLAIIGDIPSMEVLEARWHFPCATTSGAPLLNHVGVMAVCNLVAARTLELSGPKGRKRMAGIEDIHDRFGEL